MRPDDGRVVPQLCIEGLAGKPLTIHGGGQQTRSFCYVSDLVDGIVKLFLSDVQVPVNIGNPSERSILDFAQAVQKILGLKQEYHHISAREDDPKRRCPDITRAKTLLNWSPRVELEAGLKSTLEYFKKSS
jgi:nucleoside-diphosphate-sugar epimerase